VNVTYRCICLILVVACLVATGCKKKDTTTDPGTTTISQAQIDAVRDTMTRDMQEMAFGSLKETHAGRKCVVMASSAQLGPPPPPRGMIRLLGQTTIYRGELDAVSSDSLTIRAAYPTSGNYKKLEIAKEDIQSIHLAR
jgi:hypothetical protein